MTTKNEVLTQIRELVNASTIPGLISGAVYKESRPADSQLEDCVINIISGFVNKFVQNGGMYIKIYYPDVEISKSFYHDTARSQVLETALYELSEDLLKLYDYGFNLDSREVYSAAVLETHEHYAIMKINYELTI